MLLGQEVSLEQMLDCREQRAAVQARYRLTHGGGNAAENRSDARAVYCALTRSTEAPKEDRIPPAALGKLSFGDF
ncbi:MAG: hypothetical protein ACLUDH_16165 [Faecalispora sporosphaeroides]|uniref:hypothetical protein n=1 Tax=Faecalispora sporosphaeroides TaxID=1549 RepID=UPI002DDC3F32|nr:hypothetical protein [Faecalispora sporosphaeroides]